LLIGSQIEGAGTQAGLEALSFRRAGGGRSGKPLCGCRHTQANARDLYYHWRPNIKRAFTPAGSIIIAISTCREAYRLLKDRLNGDRRTRWQRALLEELTPIAQDVARLQDDPLYQSPFTGTTPNHYCLWSSTVYLASKVFNRRDWKNLTAKVL